tara:strand:+ start:52 stop:1671 length:1620 start_codon:yes stop_codon:yes gene_type:complete
MSNINHNFWLGLNKKNDTDNPESLYLFYKTGSKKILKRLPIKIKASIWDNSAKSIKRVRELDYMSEVEYINELKSRISQVKIEMSKGVMSIDTAWLILLDKNKDGIIETFIENDLKLTNNSRVKYLSYLKGLEKHLPITYKPLQYVHIQDNQSVEVISNTLKQSKLKNSTISDYMGMLDYITRRANLKVQSPFASLKLKPQDDEVSKLPRTINDLYKGMQGIQTKKDYLSLCMWLYSFSLRGLGGGDICNLSEDLLEGDYTRPYYPDYAIDLDYYSTLKEKAHVYIRRGKKKNQKPLTILINTFPSYFLHQALRQLIKEEYIEYSYKGKDLLRLFNFTTKDKDYNDILKGKANWSALRDTISKKTQKLIGAGLHNTRHTFTTAGNSYSRLNDSEQRELIGQKSKGALNHYQSELQIKTDLNHLHILDDFQVISLTKVLFQLGEQRGYMSQRLSKPALDLFNHKKLLTFSPEDELKLQKLQNEWVNNPTIEVVNGNIMSKQGKKPKQLIDLEGIKSNLLEVNEVDISEEAVKDGLTFSFI